MLFSFKLHSVGANVFLSGEVKAQSKSYSEIRLDSNTEIVINARFPCNDGGCNALTIKSNRDAIKTLISKGFDAIALSEDGMQILAAKSSDGRWTESGAVNNIGCIERVDDEIKVVIYEELVLTPAREEDNENLKHLYGLSNIRYSGVFVGKPDLFNPVVFINGVPVALRDEDCLPEEKLEMQEKHDLEVSMCGKLISEHMQMNEGSIESLIVWDCDYEGTSIKNVKLYENQFCKDLSAKFSHSVIVEAIENTMS
ncbi:hypothetical protein [Vibrio sp. D431a]|uniref:hypothetical protein n=1 Tax=Vibrio sp. D431a TaxID=2837388 RepID=UPI0025558133|nr:hypothetical protein [Vibrio sp. D431a]MDK9789851.1 hypothetical protein [Vibrio sp. D431a]